MARREPLPINKIFARNFVIFMFHSLRLFLRLLPLKAGLAIGGLIGKAAYLLFKSERKTAIKNLTQAFPEKGEDEIKDIARDSFINLGKNLTEVLNIKRIRKRFDDYVEIEGEEHLRNAVKNSGCIYVTGHVGNWELMACFIAYRGFALKPIARRVYDEKLNDFLLKLRRDNGVDTILRRKRNTTRRIVRTLKNHGVLGLLVDQDINVQGIFVDFFNKKAYTTVAVSSLAMKFKTDVVVGYIHREGDKHKIVMSPLKIVDTGDKEADIIKNTTAYTKAVEDAIRKYPAQWVWMHKRWKRKPGESAPKDILNAKI